MRARGEVGNGRGAAGSASDDALAGFGSRSAEGVPRAQFSGLEDFLLPSSSASLLFRLHTTEGMNMEDAFTAVPDENKVQLIELKMLVNSLVKAQKLGEKKLAKAAKTARQKEVREDKLRKAGLLGKEPVVMSRGWDEIVKMQKTKEARQQEKAKLTYSEEKRQHYEAKERSARAWLCLRPPVPPLHSPAPHLLRGLLRTGLAVHVQRAARVELPGQPLVSARARDGGGAHARGVAVARHQADQLRCQHARAHHRVLGPGDDALLQGLRRRSG